MEYQKITNLLDDTTNKPSKFRTRKWVEINAESRGAYNNDGNNNNDGKLITLNLKHQWSGQVDVIIVMHTYLLKEL